MQPPHLHAVTRKSRSPLGLVCATLVALLLAGLTPTTTAQAQPAARARDTTNPLAAQPWGIDTRHEVYKAYAVATGTQKKLLAKMALRPTVFWFTSIAPTNDVTRRVSEYVRDAQDGNPDTLVQLAIFRLWPNGEARRDDPVSLAERRAYRRWVDNAARGIGSARAAVLIEPDLAVALKGWRPAVRLRLARYAVEVFSALPRTTVYLDAGSSDWLSVPQAVSMLRAAGIRHTRGFALGATHYASVASEIAYGTKLVNALRDAGFPGRRFILDTADSGRPFTWTQYWNKHPNGDFDNAEHCRTRAERRCVTLGIPPTTKVADARWGLSPRRQRQARRNIDAYLWFSRPWYVYARPAYFDLLRTLAVARTSPY